MRGESITLRGIVGEVMNLYIMGICDGYMYTWKGREAR